jgi:plastocyanin
MRLTAAMLVLGSVMLGCGGGGGGDGGTPPSTTTIAKASNSGDGQSGTVKQALANPLQVVVTDGGAPAVGTTVTWATTAAGGTLDPASATTDGNGIASSTWTLGNVAGAQSATATRAGASGSPVTFTATAAAGAATSLASLSGDQQRGEINSELAEPVVAKVSDQFGNGVAGVPVAWAATGASVSAASVPTDASGASAVNVTLGGTVGSITITATAASLTGSPVTFTGTADEPAPPTTNITIVNNAFQPGSITVSAGTTVTWTWAATAIDHNVTPVGTEPARSGNPRDGPATYQFTFNTPGTYAYYCQIHGGPTFGMRGTVIVQ